MCKNASPCCKPSSTTSARRSTGITASCRPRSSTPRDEDVLPAVVVKRLAAEPAVECLERQPGARELYHGPVGVASELDIEADIGGHVRRPFLVPRSERFRPARHQPMLVATRRSC